MGDGLFGLALEGVGFGEEAGGVADAEFFEEFFGGLVPVVAADDAFLGEDGEEFFDEKGEVLGFGFFGAESLSDADGEVVVEVEVGFFDGDGVFEEATDGAGGEKFLVEADDEADEGDEEGFGDVSGDVSDAFVGGTHDGGDAGGGVVEAGGIESLVVAGGAGLGFDLGLGVLDELHGGGGQGQCGWAVDAAGEVAADGDVFVACEECVHVDGAFIDELAWGVVFGDVDDDLADEGGFEVLELFKVVCEAVFAEGGVGVGFGGAGEEGGLFEFVEGDAQGGVADGVDDELFGDAVSVVVDCEVAFVKLNAAGGTLTLVEVVCAGGVDVVFERACGGQWCAVEGSVDVLVDAFFLLATEVVDGDDLAVCLELCVCDGQSVRCVAKFARWEVFESGVVGLGGDAVVGYVNAVVGFAEVVDADFAVGGILAEGEPGGAVAVGEDGLFGCGGLFAMPVDLADAEVDFEGGAQDVVKEGEIAVFAFELVFEKGLDAAGGFVIFRAYALDGDGVFGRAEGFEQEGQNPVDGGLDVSACPVGGFGKAGEFDSVVFTGGLADFAAVLETRFDAGGVMVFGAFLLAAKFVHDAFDLPWGEGVQADGFGRLVVGHVAPHAKYSASVTVLAVSALI